MKHLYTVILLFLFAGNIDAQKIRFTDTSNVWCAMYNATQVYEPHYFSFNGDSIINGLTYQKLYGGYLAEPVLIREDTVLQKVYILPNSNIGNDTGTAERLLYDYTLQVGDTITQIHQSDTFRHYVSGIDSVLINNVWHKVWDMSPVTSDQYYVIEGIGAIRSPWFPAYPVMSLGFYVFSCFTNADGQPLVAPSVGNFDNYNSCLLNLKSNVSNKNVAVFPNPITNESKIVFNTTIKSGQLSVFNSIGQKVIDVPVLNTTEYKIGDKITVQGLYYFILTDGSDNSSYTGKFVYQIISFLLNSFSLSNR